MKYCGNCNVNNNTERRVILHGWPFFYTLWIGRCINFDLRFDPFQWPVYVLFSSGRLSSLSVFLCGIRLGSNWNYFVSYFECLPPSSCVCISRRIMRGFNGNLYPKMHCFYFRAFLHSEKVFQLLLQGSRSKYSHKLPRAHSPAWNVDYFTYSIKNIIIMFL